MGIRNEHKGRLMTIEEAIQALKKEKRTALHENKAAFDMAIKALEQEPRWIPCSERLPVENTTVMGANRYGDIYKTELYEDCGEKKWYSDGSFDVPIVAWMPLPELYKGESEG